VFVTVSCPVATCGRNRSFNGCSHCICGAYLIAKPSARRKTLDVSDKGPTWRWHCDPEGLSTIMVTRVEWDERRQQERSYSTEERGFWTFVHEAIVQLHPDYRRSRHALVDWRISFDPRRQKEPHHAR
jgi:hypothetical protein